MNQQQQQRNNQQQFENDHDAKSQTYLKRHGDAMIVLLRRINKAVKYIVCAIVFFICVTRTYPGDPGVLPAYYLISSLLLAAVVKILKKIFKQPRPEPEQCPYHHPRKFVNNNKEPTNIVVGGGGGDDVVDTNGENEQDKNTAADDDDDNDNGGLNDDHGMPSSHSALLGFFSWIGIFSFFSHDAFGLFSRSLSGVVGVLLPMMQILFDGSVILGLLNQQQESSFESAISRDRASDSLVFFFMIIMICLTMFALGLFGASLRVINGDHSWEQAFVGYFLGFLWACASVVLENKVFDVNAQIVQVQFVWFYAAILLGLIGGYYILIAKKKKRFYEAKKQ